MPEEALLARRSGHIVERAVTEIYSGAMSVPTASSFATA